MPDIIAAEEHKRRVRFRMRLQLVALGAAIVGIICFMIVLQGHVQSAVLGGIGIAGIGVALVAIIWARIYTFVIIAKRPTPPPRF
jgi:uncharacterized membrane protein